MANESATAREAGDAAKGAVERGSGFVNALDRPKQLLLGYLLYTLVGTILLCLPVSQEAAVSLLDNLFIATSAVSTTGLVTVDPGATYSLFGEVVIIVLIQVGGLGYMTMTSVLLVALRHRLSPDREDTVRTALSLPDGVDLKTLLVSVALFTVLCEAVGALLLWREFAAAGEPRAVWSAIFHAISAFCTAGFSLNADSLMAYRASVPVNLIVATLSLFGAMGFIVVVDVVRMVRGRTLRLGELSKIILALTGSFLLIGTLALGLFDGSLAQLPTGERLLAAFFQTMTASTTVGFSTVDVTQLSLTSVVVIYALMLIGASPAGTGGGIKTSTFASLWGLGAAVLQGFPTVRFFGRTVPQEKVRAAAATLIFYLAALGLVLLVLAASEADAAFEVILFEAMSALGTVGLSLGLTGTLSEAGKVTIIIAMLAGRLGLLTFAYALASGRDSERRREPSGQLV